MYCRKCGNEYSDEKTFCPQCGERLTLEELEVKLPTNVQKNRKIIKVLSIVSLVIQGVLNLLVIIMLSVLSYALQQSFPAEDLAIANSGFGVIITLSLFSITGSFAFTLLGIKKNSTGFFIGATIFAFISTTFGCANFESLVLRQLIVLGIVATYIVMTVLNHQCNKEYRVYASQQKEGDIL